MSTTRVGLVFGVLFIGLLGCGAVRHDVTKAKQDIKATKDKVKKDLKKIQLHGEVDLEVMVQLTAVNEAYRNYLEKKSAPPSSWTDLSVYAAQASSVQEAQRQNAYVRFGVTHQQIADEAAKLEKLIAIKSLNDNSIWSVTFGGDVVSVSDEEYAALTAIK